MSHHGYVVHEGVLRLGDFAPGDEVRVCVNAKRRKNMAENNTARVVVGHVLNEMLGDVKLTRVATTDWKLHLAFTCDKVKLWQSVAMLLKPPFLRLW